MLFTFLLALLSAASMHAAALCPDSDMCFVNSENVVETQCPLDKQMLQEFNTLLERIGSVESLTDKRVADLSSMLVEELERMVETILREREEGSCGLPLSPDQEMIFKEVYIDFPSQSLVR
jgi:hypothetical protein